VEEKLARYIARHTPPHLDPHDVKIETVLRAVMSARRLPPGARRVGYLRRIADNVIRDLHGAQSTLVDRRAFPAASVDPPVERVSREELSHKCLAFLRGRERELFIWKYVEGLTDAECARRRKCRLEAIWAAKSRLHKRLRKRFCGLLLLLPALVL
jgi:DNA-directed RNA polymerase specialized sigma24 family protein